MKNTTISWLHYNEAKKAQEDEINEQLLCVSRVFDVSILKRTFVGGFPTPTRIVFADNRYYHNKKEYILEKTKPELLEVKLVALTNDNEKIKIRFNLQKDYDYCVN